MYLKKIETQGFKSFANKMVLEFRPGIMGIVGPNGSGKSNVADAVRWVLGEQSAKQLRGSNMQDVIFAGTENRKPQGYAYVALTIENSDHMLAVDYDEVTISRRVYRSGESEYRINSNLCRLKDILELFYDTGVGKEGYSIIGQGQIDKILSGKPEDRRELFDEAAGIVKFKKRKTMTLKKLETEEGNLTRVADILHELEKQVGPLERQSERAREYLRLRDELRLADVQAFRMEVADNDRRHKDASDRLAIVQADADRTSAEVEEIRLRYEELSAQLDALDGKLEEQRQTRSDAGIRVENLEGQLRLLDEKLRAAEMNEQAVRERIESLQQQMKDRDQEAEKLEKSIDAAEENIEKQRESVALAEVEYKDRSAAIDDLEKELEDLQQKQLQAAGQMTQVAADLQRTETMLEQSSSRSAELLKRLSGSEGEQTDVESQIRDAEKKIKIATANLKKYQDGKKTALEAQNEAQREQTKNNDLLSRTNQRYLSIKSHRESLLRLTERYEGYNNATRKVMEQRQNYPGILGVVADLFHTEARYEVAIEIALGGRIQNIVTDTEQTAKDMIGYLKENRAGRATFLPLSSIQARDGFPRPEAVREKGALGVASELVQVEPRFRVVANFLLGRTLVVDTIDHALAIARKYRYTLNLVTLEGDSLSPGGAMTGGSRRGNNNNLLGRRREIDEMKTQQDAEQKKLDQLRNEALRLEKEIQNAQYLFNQMQEREHEAELELNTLNHELQGYRDQEENLAKGIQNWEEERNALAEQIRSWTELRDSGLSQQQSIQEEIDACESRHDEVALSLEGARDERDRAAKNLERLRQAVSALEQQKGFQEQNLSRVRGEKEAFRQEKENVEDGIHSSDEMRLNHAAQQKQIQGEITSTKENLRVLDELIRSMSADREKLNTEQRESLSLRDEKQESLRILEKDILRIQSTLERLEEQKQKLVNYIWEEYELTPSEAMKAAGDSEDISLTEARRRVSRSKGAIKELGPVNVNAIEEYKEVSERYVFMKAQHDDLVKAAESLKKIIQDLDESMKRQFKEKFAQIQSEFDRVFQELFGGGRGRLELQDDDHILETGIIINAQPPGKKLQNMMQLSGGEKALSAIALLFAIQNLKPSPFCLLDEIEAALDEPNVDRYAAYLNKLKDHTQFIVITHRRGTMEMADRLYGITMQEKGVSALVSVDLSDSSLTS